MGLWNWFVNLFRSNLTIMQIAVKELTLVLLRTYPQMKTPLVGAAVQVQSLLSAGLQISSLSSLPDLIKSKVDMSKMSAEQQIILGPVIEQFISSITDEIGSYVDKNKLVTPSKQTEIVSKVVGWISETATMV